MWKFVPNVTLFIQDSRKLLRLVDVLINSIVNTVLIRQNNRLMMRTLLASLSEKKLEESNSSQSEGMFHMQTFVWEHPLLLFLCILEIFLITILAVENYLTKSGIKNFKSIF